MTDREAQYIKETGDKKPIYHNNLATHNTLVIEWFKNYTTWLSKRLEKAEKIVEAMNSMKSAEVKRYNLADRDDCGM
jgi:hypothetical protein